MNANAPVSMNQYDAARMPIFFGSMNTFEPLQIFPNIPGRSLQFLTLYLRSGAYLEFQVLILNIQELLNITYLIAL